MAAIRKYCFPLIFLLVACFAAVFAVYFPNHVPDTSDMSAYKFYSSFMPAEDFIAGENGSLLWKPSWATGQTRELKFCDELVFPEESAEAEKYPYSTPPEQNSYNISFQSEHSSSLRMYFTVTDEEGRRLKPMAPYNEHGELISGGLAGNELSLTKMYLLKYLDGAWYHMYDSEDYGWYGGQTEIPLTLLLFGDGMRDDVAIGYHPLPSGRYALALCEDDILLNEYPETRNCYGLLEFELIQEYVGDEDEYLQWIWDGEQQHHSGLHHWEMPAKYRVQNIGETIYHDPYAA